MEVVIIVASVVGIIILIVLLCRCCNRRNRGQVLAPPAVPVQSTVTVQVPYPQQQYNHIVTPYPVSPYPQAMPQPGPPHVVAAPYPTGAPYPHPAPNAPEAYAHPPSYDDVVRVASSTPSGPDVKQPPYNPYLSH
ncbi:protein shisa-5-like isoform X2 [Achroia grisella]|nr:protein shisa-5-like isoform X2 [Achroia grisella]